MRVTWVATLGAAALTAAGAGTAQAGTAQVGDVAGFGQIVQFSGAGSDQDRVTIRKVGATQYRVSDPTRSVSPGSGCTTDAGPPPNSVTCNASTLAEFEVDSGDGDDVVTVAAADAQALVDAGPGDDLVTTAGADDFLVGGPGDDTLDGAGGTDEAGYFDHAVPLLIDLDAGTAESASGETDSLGQIENVTGGSADDYLLGADGPNHLNGGDGHDWLQGRQGADTLVGGDGLDAAIWYDHDERVAADPDGQLGDDGASGEGDTTESDVEDLVGGAGDDELVGSAGDNVLLGGPGNDRLRGLGGNDTASYLDRVEPVQVDLDGQDDDGGVGEADSIEADVENVYGGAGDDTLAGNDGPNVVFGDEGDDDLTGNGGEDALTGFSGNDVVRARDGARDDVDCGDGDDLGLVDAIDDVFDCERDAAPAPPVAAQGQQQEPEGQGPQTTPPVVPPVMPTPDGIAPRPQVTIGAQRLKAVLKKGLKVRVKADEAATIAGQARLPGRSGKVVGNGSVRMSKPGSATVTIKFSRSQAKKLVRKRRVKLVIQIVATDDAGNRSAPVKQSVTLKR